jgi:hypothetical protein
MHKDRFIAGAVALLSFAAVGRPQVLAPAEISEPAMRALQQKHLLELKAAAADISAHHYPHSFYLSRRLDIPEKQEQVTDQRSVYFANFQGRVVLQVTGNYFAAYPDQSNNRAERVTLTYLDVVLPILRAIAPRLENEARLDAFAVEVSHHVRKKVSGVVMEKAENLAIIVPRDAAAKAALSADVNDQIAALRQSQVYVDSAPVALWPGENKAPAAAATTLDKFAVTETAVAGQPTNPAPSPPQSPAPTPPPGHDVSLQALQTQQAAYQETLDRMVKDLDSQAHFVAYAPPSLIAFRKQSYLQLSITTTLAPSDSGSQYRIAALAFDRHVSHLIRPVLASFKQDPNFDGIVFSTSVHFTGGADESSPAQSVEFFFPMGDLRRYEQYDVTGQQLINAGFVLVNGERVSLDLQSAESTIR